MTTTVDSFIKIFKFYQENPILRNYKENEKRPGIYDKDGKIIIDPKTKKPKKISLNDIFKFNRLRYSDTIDVYLNSLVLDKYTQLSLDTDEDTSLISTALQTRESMKKYITNVFYPGSYAFNTSDNTSMRRMILDWTSTIKTLQDSNKKLTDAYSLNSEDIDKALRGFGTDFINQTSLLSLSKRKNFLLNVCDLYSIKGTPQSIIKALNIIGINNIFIREGWMYHDTSDNHDDIKISWQAIKEKSTFNASTNQYEDLRVRDDMITDWNWFETKIHSYQQGDPHWMYTQNDIKEIEKTSLITLPSITPYFGIEFVTNADKQVNTYETLFRILNKQFQKYLKGNDTASDYRIQLNEYDKKLSILQAYTCLVYCLIRLDDHLQYENFKSFLASSEIKDIPEFTGKYEYFNLIYWFYKKHKDEDDFDIIKNYIPIKSNNYCSYEQLLTWWLESEYSEEEKELIDVTYITPTKGDDSSTHILLNWKSPVEFGRYGVEVYNSSLEDREGNGWREIVNNGYSYQENMSCVVPTDDIDGGGQDMENFRIVYYHTYDNIPQVFFETPFNLNGLPQDTFLDRVVRYNGPSLGLDYYKDTEIGQIFSNHGIESNSTDFDVISGYHETETMTTGVRFTDIDTTLKSIYSSVFKYPNLTRLYEDKWMNINNDFYNFVDWSIKDFYDTQKHVGLLENERNLGKDSSGILRKYPVNSKWNWAVDSQYFYYCYEANKWCRLRIDSIKNIDDIENVNLKNILQKNSTTYGSRFYNDDGLYICVALNTFAYIPNTTIRNNETEQNIVINWGNNEDVLYKVSVKHGSTKYDYFCKIKPDSKLSRDLAVGQIKDSYILELIAKDFETSNATKGSPEEETRNKLLKTLDSEIIEVYKDPYNRVEGDSYSYQDFLTYLYNSRLTLDLSTGYIYPNYKELISRDKIYLSTTNSDGKPQWIQINPEFSWDGAYIIENGEKIYAETIYVDGQDQANLGFLYPPYTFQNRYDSLRFLDGPVYDQVEDLREKKKESDVEEDEDEIENNEIDSSINYVLIRNDDNHSIPVVYKRIISMNKTKTGSKSTWEECTDNRIYSCNYGIGPDVLEFIESRYAENDQYYVYMVNDFTETINDYIFEILGIEDVITDLSIANYSTSGIVNKIINYYKPKRARMLFLSDVIEGDYGVGDNLDSLNIADNDFNYYDLASYRYGVPNKRDLSKMNRTKISINVNEYTPLEDTIFKKGDNSGEIYSLRELYVDDSKIPELEVFDEVLNLNQQVFKGVKASFYAQNLEGDNDNQHPFANGFYFKLKDDEDNIFYTNNSYIFKKISCMVKIDTSIKFEDRWAIFTVKDTVFNHATCTYIANKKSNDPFRDLSNKNDTTVKYALRDIKKYPKYISTDIDDYKYGVFYTDNIIKTNKRTLEPVLYISGFDKAECNGFYYQDSTLKPDRNGKSVYFNQHGKIISYTKPLWFVDEDVDEDSRYIYDKDNEGNYVNNKTFWIITDDKEIIEFKDAFYFIICDDKETFIFEKDNETLTKPFHESTNKYDDVKITKGVTRDIYQQKGIVDDIHGYKKAIYDNYIPYTRNHFNSVILKNQPALYLYTNNKKVTSITYIDDDSKTAKINVNLNNTDFAIDKEGNTYGAVKVNGNNSGLEYDIQYQDTPEWTISFRILFETQEDIEKIFTIDISTSEELSSVTYIPLGVKPNTWLMFTLTSEGNYYINDALEDINLNSKYFDFSISDRKLSINNINCKVSEFGFWNYVLNDWYIDVISKFRILRCRPEPQKSKTSRSPNNYRPLFAIDSPRTIYPLGQTALPENVIGDRLNGYNADTRYNSKTHKSEVNALWKYDHDHKDDHLYVKNGACTESLRLFKSPFEVNDGTEYQSNSNYNNSNNKVPYWWIKDPALYKSGPVSHKPVYISTKITVNEKYPHIRKGNECKPGNYLDIGLCLDGVGNIDSSEYNGVEVVYVRNESKWYYDITFDPYSSFTLEYNKYVLYYDYYSNLVGYTNNQIWDRDHNSYWPYDQEIYGLTWNTAFIGEVYIQEVNNYYPTKYVHASTVPVRFIKISNVGGTFDKKKITNDSIIVPDIAQLVLSEKYKENGIFHDSLYFVCDNKDITGENNTSINMSHLCGEWKKNPEVESFRDGDFECCYTHSCGHTGHTERFEAVLTYQKESGYFWWEIRFYEPSSDKWYNIARTFVANRFNVSRTMKWKDYVNWNQIDLCGQMICSFKETDYDDFKNKSWGIINQNILTESRFVCGKIIKIETEECPQLKDYNPENLQQINIVDEQIDINKEDSKNTNALIYKPELQHQFDITDEEVYKKTTFYKNKHLYFYDSKLNKWYKSKEECVDVDWDDEFPEIIEENNNQNQQEENNTEELLGNSNESSESISKYPSTPSRFVCRKINSNGDYWLYFYDNITNKWVKLNVGRPSVSGYSLKTLYYQPWKYYTHTEIQDDREIQFGVMNVIDSSDRSICDCFENCFVIPSAINIIETYRKFIKFNDKPEYDQSKHINEEFNYLKSVNNNVSICRCSVKDSVYVYLYTRNKSALLTTYDYAIDVDPEDTISYDDPDWFTKFKTKAPYVEY